MDTERSAATSLSPEEHKAYKRRALAALDDIAELHREILERRGGVPIDIDGALDEPRPSPHEHPTPDGPRAAPSAILTSMDTERLAAASLSPEEHKAYKRRALAALDRIEARNREILARRGGVPIDVDRELDEMRGYGDRADSA